MGIPGIGWPEILIGAIVLVAYAAINLTQREGGDSPLRKRGNGMQGIVRNIVRNTGHTNFWLELSGGKQIPVEDSGQDLYNNGDRVWVRGDVGEGGILRTNQVEKLEGEKKGTDLEKRKGKASFTGSIIGDPIWVEEDKQSFRVQRVDEDGNPLDIIECQISTSKFVEVSSGDSVYVKGKWNKRGTFQTQDIRNITTRTMIKPSRELGKYFGLIVFLIFIAVVVYFILTL